MRAEMPQTIVIIGAGQAGGWAARTLREKGFTGRVVLVGDEAHPPHERPPLSKSVLLGSAAPQSTHLWPPQKLQALQLDLRLSTRAAALDRAGRQVCTASGEQIGYDRLLLCTGGRARELQVPGADLPGVYALRTIEDALKLGQALRQARRVAVIGGGWIGLEVAAAARSLGAAVSVIEAAPRLCARTMPAQVSDYLARLHAARGADVLLNRGLARIERQADGLWLELTSGEALPADVVVAGVGLMPNDDLARAAGLDCDGGILVDQSCRSSDAHILAAGDVAVSRSRWAGGRIRLESWQNAQNQAIAAAAAALDDPVAYDPLPWFWSDQFGVNLQVHGLPRSEHRVVVRGDPETDSFQLFYLQQEFAVAVVGINAAREMPLARRLIEQQVPLQDELLRDRSRALPRR
jgi:3-phenylpropionate/trans-cinnamate dioxygenase ferredoxin reductase component